MINLVNWQQEEPTDCGGERQLSMDGTSRVSREAQARICERLGVRFPGATRPSNERRLLDVSSILKWAGTKEQRVFQPSTRTAGLFTTIPIYCDFLRSGCVPGEDKVASFGLIVAGKAGTHKRLVARFAVFEVSEPPTARHGVLFE